jgi:glycosyltransferase involved in cell wall biosynthesis
LIREPKSPSELAELYRGALAFVFPSIHETFGIPIIEAMASGCPVITSKGSACPEIAGDAALLVDPRSVEEIGTAMGRMVLDAGLRNRLRNDGVIRSKCFSWTKSAHRHLAVFEAACSGEGR